VNFRDFLAQRDSEFELILEPGQYLVMPRTTGCGMRRPDDVDSDYIKLIDN
jgi:hypothetical protein